MKILICGGGTAGHVYPGLALAEAIKMAEPGAEIVWVGTSNGLEADLVPLAGYSFRVLDVSGLIRRPSFEAVKSLYQMAGAYRAAGKLLKKERPAIVVGMGGYAGLPVLLAASRHYPTVVLEQNSIPGLANRILSGRVSAVILTYNESRQFIRGAKRVAVCGNPIRPQVLEAERTESAERLGIAAERLTVLIFGGSRGSRRLNQAAAELYDRCREDEGLQLVHITGNMEYRATAELIAKRRRAGDKVLYQLYPYLTDIWLAYAAADLLVCRAGATTLAEMTARGLPAILVPYPHATDDHQTKNAEILVAAGAARMITDADLDGERLWRSIADLISDRGALAEMARKSAAAGRPDAADEAAAVVLSLVGEAYKGANDSGKIGGRT